MVGRQKRMSLAVELIKHTYFKTQIKSIRYVKLKQIYIIFFMFNIYVCRYFKQYKET